MNATTPRRSSVNPLVKLGLLLSLCQSTLALAAPEAHLLRVDPRAARENGSPILTTVVEVVESKRLSDVLMPCATLSGDAQLGCISDSLDRTPLYSAFPFPPDNAIFTVKVDGSDSLAKYLGHTRWGEAQAQQQPGVGTAWLIVIDADSRMGASFEDAKELANKFIASMGANDIVNLVFLGENAIAGDSHWLPANQRAKATAFVSSVPTTFRQTSRNRRLSSLIQTAVNDAFKTLGNVDQQSLQVPLHQAMVVLSTGYGGADAQTSGPGALELRKYLTRGRFPDENTALPKVPLPVISVLFPARTVDEYKTSTIEFMQNLANPEIGGAFTVMQAGQRARSQTIVNSVRARFSKMYIVKWRVSCVNPATTQTFGLNFNNVKPPILGDNTFQDVPVGIDPTTWPLDIDVAATVESAKKQGGVYPGGKVKVYGNFCWGGDTQRAEVYFLPAGQPLPTSLAGADVDRARKTQQQLIEMGMRGRSTEATDSYVEFEAADKDKILHGAGAQAVVRLVVYDNKAKRTSGVTADSILQLPGTTQPFPVLPVLGGALGLVVIALLIVVVFRSGGKKSPARPAPVMSAPPAPFMPGQPMPMQGVTPYAAPTPVAAPAVNPEFMYGRAPPAGYGAPPAGFAPVGGAQRAVLQGTAGVFTVVPGAEMHVGRDGARAEILMSEPRVSGLHASLRFENGQLVVRDENSNNGTLVNGARVAPGVWTPVPNGSLLRFGPIELSVRLE